jgi:predicted RNA-binding Zn ribbon-like protein
MMSVDEDASNVPMVGGHVALDLVNTVAPRIVEPGEDVTEYLANPAALLVWARRAELVDDAEADAVAIAWDADPGVAHAALCAVKDVREALHTTLLAAMGVEPADDDAGAALDQLHCRWTAATGRSALALDPGGERPVRLVVGVAPAHVIPDRVAQAALDLLHTADFGRLHRCPTDEGGCGWLFLDRSRNGSRRWCSMSDCGTEVKARRLTERRRVARKAMTNGEGSRG